MASLRSSLAIAGSASVSSLIRSATTLRNQINTFNDTQARLNYENSAKTDADLQQYLSYLKGRVDTLSSIGSISDATKAMEMQQTMITATHANISATIQRENIQIMSGNATNTDKLGVIQQQYMTALKIGDQALAQQLESQAYSLSQTIQIEQQAQADQARSLQAANDSAIKRGYGDALTALKSDVTDMLSANKSGDSSGVNKALEQFGGIYKQLTGKSLPKGVGANMGSAVQAYFTAAYAYNMKAAQALGVQFDANGMPVPGSGDAHGYGMDFANAAHSIVAGQSAVDVPGLGKVNTHQAQAWASSPNLYGSTTDASGNTYFTKNRITGYQYVNGVLTPVSDGQRGTVYGSLDKNAKNNITQQLAKLGLVVKSSSNGELEATFTNKSDKWTQYGKGNGDLASSTQAGGAGSTVTLVPLANGSFQFEKGGKAYTIAFDSKGLGGVFQTNSDGSLQHVAGQYGFNQQLNTMVANATVQQLQQKSQLAAEQVSQNAMQTRQTMAANFIKNVAQGSPLPGTMQPSGPTMAQRAGGGFNFTNNGKAISAAEYSKLTNTPFRNLLQTMANKGDSGAQTALQFVGNDYGYDPTKSVSYQNGNLYNALTWGVGVKPITQGQAPGTVFGNGAELKF